MHRHSPLFVVIVDIERIVKVAPTATRLYGIFRFHDRKGNNKRCWVLNVGCWMKQTLMTIKMLLL